MASVLGLMWLRVKRNDAAAFATLGISPAAIGAKAGLETVLPLVAGTLLGAAVARLSLSIYAPSSDLEPGTFQRAVVYTLIAALATTVLVSLRRARQPQDHPPHRGGPPSLVARPAVGG